MSACGHDPLMIQALVDGELDAVHAAEVEVRIAACPTCAEEHARLLALREVLRAPGVRAAAPEALRRRLAESLAAPTAASAPMVPLRPRLRPLAWMGGGAGLAAAACAALVFVSAPMRQDQILADELVVSHVRSLQLDHLTDVVTSDQHVVKPWFNGKIDFSPPVVELKDQGFPLVGGRLDYVGRRTVAAIVYRRGRHVINLYVWPDDGRAPPAHLHVGQGYDLRHWRSGGMTWWAVSDVNPADLAQFESLMKARTGG